MISNIPKLKNKTYFPMPDNRTEIFPSGLVERLVRPMQEHSGPRALLRIA